MIMNTSANEPSTPPPTTTTSIKSTDLRKMGSSIIRHCRRRTQSDPQKKYKREKATAHKDKTNSSSRHSMDGVIQIDRGGENDFLNNDNSTNISSNNNRKIESINNTRTIRTLTRLDTLPDEEHLVVVNEHKGITELSTDQRNSTINTLDTTNYTITSSLPNNFSGTSNSSNSTTTANTKNDNEKTALGNTSTGNDLDNVTLRLRKSSHCSQTSTTAKPKDIMDIATTSTTNANNSRRASSNCSTSSRKNSTKSIASSSTVFQHQEQQTTDRSPADKSNCFSKFICCRRNRRKNSNTNSFKNNNVYPYTLEEYLRVPDSPLSSTADSRSTCFSSLSTEVNSVSSPTLSSSEPSQVFSSENSSTNLSHDSGFDEPKCFINMIYENHRCKGYYSCHKKDKASLNIHLKNLMNCMPRSFGDHDDPPSHLTDTLRHMSSGTCLSKRRNAICETSDDMRVKFYEALCSFMTLQAMAKYDFL